jgi:hypothetical protein
MKYFITGTRRGLGKALEQKYGNCNSLQDCDIFINCKHEGFNQVYMLYEAADLNKRIINISSNSGDGIKKKPHVYAVEKNALDKANEQLYYQGIQTTSVRFGWFDSERVADVIDKKMSIEYCVGIIDWILQQPHLVKEVTITP